VKADATLDCYGLVCPMPIIQTAKKIKEMKPGQVLEILSTDAGIREDMPAWCRTTGQEFLGVEQAGEVFKAYVRKVKD
jgi:TusA-related sulfurtransferase